ncbi:sensor histidine kinase [Paenibacillus sp. PK3_47]|uniref:sensor histidine kinase n=1 Tax=Paenibacillus sp. PK3_47 TaxID=2072642 RepID=UPI00201D3239|nr:HAMP domain-containing sensor histidine kinase [Paenibacillus sp. PK3_47]UQZ34506.1 sensor histidine kinase [Paenibacillus sp. PK3_47]
MRWPERLFKLRSSLLSRYLIIIISALLFIPVVIPLTLLVYGLAGGLLQEEAPKKYGIYSHIGGLETMWHEEAEGLLGQPPQAINARLQELSEAYPEATLFWVDNQGKTMLKLVPEGPEFTGPEETWEIPAQWSAAEAVDFMKMSTELDPLAIVAFIGDRAEAQQGFMVMQIPAAVRDEQQVQSLGLWYSIVLLLIFALFIAISWLFFIGIRRRLLRLQKAMSFTGGEGIPEAIITGKPDEIGRLEEAFNTMVTELHASRAREAEEEGLRKRLVADLSHDLRTPLTVIRSHLHVLGKEELSPRGQESLDLMDERIAALSVLIENLLSYNLLSSGRIRLNPERRDILRLLRESAAAWYPLWEKEGFDVDINLEGEPLYWTVDDSWFRRILDNLFQNIMRHARSGLYVGVSAEVREGHRVIVISDHGPGMENSSEFKGAGLGLSIVNLLIERMGLQWKTDSTELGTSILIFQPQDKNLN